MQPQRPLLVPQCSPRAQLGLPAERRSRQRSCNRWLLPAARCLSHADARHPTPPPPHPEKALLPSLRGPKPCGLSRPCVQAPFLCLLASSPGPSRGLRDCTGRNSPRLAAARTTSSPFTTSVSKLPASLSPHSENQSHYVCTVRSKEVATSGKHTSLSPGGSLDQRLAGGVPKKSTSSRPSAEMGLQQGRPHHLKHHPIPLKPCCAPHLSISPAPRAPPPQPAPSPCPYFPKRKPHPTPTRLPTSPICTPPPHAQVLPEPFQIPGCPGTCLCIWRTGLPPPTPYPLPQARACSSFCFFQHEENCLTVLG